MDGLMDARAQAEALFVVRPKPAGEDQEQMVKRDEPNVPAPRRELVKKWRERVIRAKAKHEKAFRRMREDQDFVLSKQWSSDPDDDRYVANFVQRHVATRTAALYAKNPKAVAARRKKMDFAIWDERPQSFQEALAAIQAASGPQVDPATGAVLPPAPLDPTALDLIQDVLEGMTKRQLDYRMAQTMTILFDYTLDEQEPAFKAQMKQMVRRAIINAVGYVKLCYKRETERRPEVAAQLAALENKLGVLERLAADQADGLTDEQSSELEETRLLVESLRNEPEQVKQEGVFYDFPLSTQIIPDPKCRNLVGWVGANWVAQEYMLSLDDIQEIYGKDISASVFTRYRENPNGEFYEHKPFFKNEACDRDDDLVCVWEIYDKKTGLVYVVADGYCDFLREPVEPEVKVEQFFPWYPLVLNEIEHEKELFPPSDVRLLRPMQKEYNRSRQGLREHRHANRPKYAVALGSLDDDDKDKLAIHQANAILELKGLRPGQKVEDLLQPIKGAPIDPAMYDTSYVFDDAQRTVGSQEANFGGTSDSTATESSIAEASRMSGIQSEVDELDDLLTKLARDTGKVMLMHYDVATVQAIVGPGYAWPETPATRTEVARELVLQVEMGSSGRPNKTVELQNFERVAPTLLQIPGIDPIWLAKEAIRRMDDRLDVNDALAANLPSITALNALLSKAASGVGAQPATGDPATDPAQQGGQGGNNAPAPRQEEPPPAPIDQGAPQPGELGPVLS